MAGILFVTWDGGGNVPPALGIAAELRRRGEEVRFLGHPQQRAGIEGAGFRFEPYTRARPWSPTARVEGFSGFRAVCALFTDRGMGRDLLAAVDREPADLVVVDCLLTGALAAADRAALRRAVLMHSFYSYFDKWRRGPLGLWAAVKGQPPGRLWHAADAVLVATLAELDLSGRRELPATVHHIGPVWQGEAAPARPDTDREPLVLISLSTNHFKGQTQALQSIVDAVAGLPVRAVVTTGHAVDPGEVRAPANVELHRYVSHAELLPMASLVIGHGGHATTMRALAHDVPLVVMPMHPMLDQRAIGEAVQAAGAGRVVAKNSSTAHLQTVVQELLRDGPHRTAAARLGARIREQDGAVRAADLLTRSGEMRGAGHGSP